MKTEESKILMELIRILSIIDMILNPSKDLKPFKNTETLVKLKEEIGKISEESRLEDLSSLSQRSIQAILADNLISEAGSTVLNRAAYLGHIENIRFLLEKGADVNTPKKDGWTPLHCAASKGYTEIAELLLGKTVSLNALTLQGFTAIRIAATNGHIEIAKLLIDRGADVNATDQDGWTPLMAATINGHTAIVKMLIDNHAKTDLKSKSEKTALMLANEQNNKESHRAIINMLEPITPKEKVEVKTPDVTPLPVALLTMMWSAVSSAVNVPSPPPVSKAETKAEAKVSTANDNQSDSSWQSSSWDEITLPSQDTTVSGLHQRKQKPVTSL